MTEDLEIQPLAATRARTGSFTWMSDNGFLLVPSHQQINSANPPQQIESDNTAEDDWGHPTPSRPTDTPVTPDEYIFAENSTNAEPVRETDETAPEDDDRFSSEGFGLTAYRETDHCAENQWIP